MAYLPQYLLSLAFVVVLALEGLDDCPLSQWEALDPQAIQEDLGELEMRLIASIALSPDDLDQGAYQERSMIGDTEIIFVAGSDVCESFAPGSGRWPS